MSEVIVTGVDGSQPAMLAALAAARLADALDAELVVVCAYGKREVERVELGGEEFVFSSVSHAREVAARALVPLRAAFGDLDVQARAEEGKPAAALIKVAEQLDASLIVVGNKRVQGLSRILGSIANEVAREAPCDVYVAHTHERH